MRDEVEESGLESDDDGRRAVLDLRARAEAAARAGDEGAAVTGYAEAVAVARRTRDARLIAHTVRHEGDLLRRAGRLGEARPRYEEALALYRADPDTPVLELANAVRLMGLLLEALGDPAAATLWAEARDLYGTVGIAAGVEEAEAAQRRLAPDATAPDAITIREAVARDLASLVTLLADDPLGAQREVPGPEALARYGAAFEAIRERPDHTLLVADRGGTPVAVLQLSFLPHLTYTGGWRAQIEGVRVAAELRSAGLGRRLLEAAIERARLRGCHLVQLTTDARRPAARAFYERLGFQATHHGMKLHLAHRAGGEAAEAAADVGTPTGGAP